VVLQINGTICPQGNNIVPGLNKGENGAPYTNTGTPPNVPGAGPKGPIDPIFDAAENPQVFAIPKTNGLFNQVTFINLLEGAGFENTFGWYNVGDDLSNLNNLHPVLACTPVNSEPTPDANAIRVVDFQTEFTAGRYKGGAVGFFLVTPEGQGSCFAPNCGNASQASCVGRIYYTEKPLNGDGNYVHNLVYQTRRTDASGKRLNDFYFGFEDLYRGGDNDFEDMLILVQGLVVPCTPSAEICDGIDNNCDGLIDNSPTDVGADCYTGPANTLGKGECKAGKTVCASTGPGDKTTVCVGSVVPAAETCDGKDNNCNGQVDENIANLPNACPPQQGACSAVTQCIAGTPKCVAQNGPKPEVCNGLDDDCNGLVDDKLTDSGLPCTPSGNDPTQGECKAGVSVCTNGVLSCSGYKGPAPELCDGKDNDCDGQVDESPVDLLAKCAPQGVQVCTSGAELCVNGAKVCSGFSLPAPELCNGIDDDCNGKIDDEVVDDGALCGSNVGACQAGLITCVNGALICVGGSGPKAEVCDGLDNDCDGQIDENPPSDKLPEVGEPCSAFEGCSGVKVCQNGTILCVGSGGSPEVCDGKDNDCNGVIDDNLTDIGALCGNNLGLCKPGTLACVPQIPGDPKSNQLVCEGELGPSPEICDGLDNDCDGFVDENPNQLPGVGVDCGGSGCGAGKTSCKNGQILCLTAGGTGKPEICNGLDDDCNGLIDDNVIDVGAPCGSSLGECEPGVLQCKPTIKGDPTSNQKVCEGGVGPGDEVCDGKDNNCNGQVDEDPDGDGPLSLPGVGAICVQPGACGSGLTLCKNGALLCQPTGQTSAEVCNGIDDDCNGIVDDNLTDINLPCGTNVGECSQGKTQCVDGALTCEGGVGPGDEVCDGKDNNCNGVTDEDPDGNGPLSLPGTGEPCAPPGLALPLQGECKPGKTVCLGGAFQCLGALGPAEEICDGKDNDCDGEVDAPDPCPGEARCIAGQCAQSCSFVGEFSNCPGGLSCVDGFCVKPGAGAGGASGAGGGGEAGSSGSSGQSGASGSAGAAGGGQAASGGASGAAGQGGDGGSGAGKSGAGGGGGQAASGGQGLGAADSDGDGKADTWGLTTGGGGCTIGAPPEPGGRWRGAGLLGALVALIRGRRAARSAKKEVA
jgi:hypothetical protein